MNRPDNFDNTQAITGDFEALKLGGHICKILDVELRYTTTGSEYLAIMFDIAEGEQAGYYKKRFDEATKGGAEAKWQGIYTQFTQGNSIGFFKGMIENIEKSNPGYSFTSTFDEKTLIGKLFGGVFGREQYKNNKGELKFATKCRNIRTVEAIRQGIEAPTDKLLPGQNNNDYSYTSDDLPF